MSRFYDNAFKNQLREQSDISLVISQFISLQRVGNNMTGLCPFHQDTHPSLQVNTQTNTFYCHSCGAGSRNHSAVQSSDVYGFLKGILNCDMAQAIEWLASFLGVSLPAEDPQEQQKNILKNQWHLHCNQASLRFSNNLMNNKEALDYLLYRGFTMNDIILWKLGYGDAQDYDFRNTKDRIVFPLFDSYGNIISFTGRVLMPDDVLKETNQKLNEESKPIIPKYLDRIGLKKDDPNYTMHPYPEFQKRNYLYGLHLAKEYIRRYRTAIIVEGWTDVIKLHKYGVQHAVATMGVALTEAQVTLLKQSGTNTAIIMRDGDTAGYEAALRDSKILMAQGIEPLIMALAPNVDPCSLCDSFNMIDDSLNKFIDRKSVPIHQYKLKKIHSDTQEEVMYHYSQIASLETKRLKEVVNAISDISDPIDKEIYIRQASELFKMNYDAISSQIQNKGSYNHS